MSHKSLYSTWLVVLLKIQLSSSDLFTFPIPQPSGKDITEQVFQVPWNHDIFPVAYADFNSDKLTDIVTLNSNRSSIKVFLAHKDSPYLRPGPEWHFHFDEKNASEIVAVTPGDFTGDGLLDFMVTLKTNHTFTFINSTVSCYNVTGRNETSNSTTSTNVTLTFVNLVFCKGNGREIKCIDKVPHELVQEPSVLDLNDDMILDLVGERWIHFLNTTDLDLSNITCKGNQTQMEFQKERAIWISSEDHPAAIYQRFHSENNSMGFEMLSPSSNAFVDVDGDLVPELVLITGPKVDYVWYPSDNSTSKSRNIATNRREVYEIVHKKGRVSFHLKSVQTIGSNQVIGQPLFIDLERTGQLVHLLPFCSNRKCDKINGIQAIVQDKVIDLPLGPLSHDGIFWAFQPPHDHGLSPLSANSTPPLSMEAFYSEALTFRQGDYNLDGYPDLIGVLKTEHEPGQKYRTKAVIFENVPCVPTIGNPCIMSRTFNPNFAFLDRFENVASATFFDILENGMADVLVLQRSPGGIPNRNNNFELRAFKNSPNFDSYFLKVVVLTGRGCPKCPNKNVPYGSLLPGALMRYEMTGQDGEGQTAVSAQMYRSAHLPMDLPYAIFGIGHSPNFIELLNVTIAYNETRKYCHVSHKIIPNSHILVIPSPIDEPKKWKVLLFLTPSDAVGHTFGVLIGLLMIVGAMAAGLEFREKRQDRRERMAEANRFMM